MPCKYNTLHARGTQLLLFVIFSRFATKHSKNIRFDESQGFFSKHFVLYIMSHFHRSLFLLINIIVLQNCTLYFFTRGTGNIITHLIQTELTDSRWCLILELPLIQVITAGGLAPDDWHSRVYSFSADNANFLFTIFTSNGRTVKK